MFELLWRPACAFLSRILSPFSSARRVALRYRFRCAVSLHDVPTLALTCIDNPCRVLAGAHVRNKTFEQCERIKGTQLCLELSMPVYASELKYHRKVSGPAFKVQLLLQTSDKLG
jgi:hypothetical protein